jgi:hypothetical protein
MPWGTRNQNFAQSRVTTDAIPSNRRDRTEIASLLEKIAIFSKVLQIKNLMNFFRESHETFNGPAREMLFSILIQTSRDT